MTSETIIGVCSFAVGLAVGMLWQYAYQSQKPPETQVRNETYSRPNVGEVAARDVVGSEQSEDCFFCKNPDIGGAPGNARVCQIHSAPTRGGQHDYLACAGCGKRAKGALTALDGLLICVDCYGKLNSGAESGRFSMGPCYVCGSTDTHQGSQGRAFCDLHVVERPSPEWKP